MATWTNNGRRSRLASQSLTEATPTNSATDGIDLTAVGAVTVVIHAPAGQTFLGGGNLLGYYFNGSVWARSPQTDFALTDATGFTDFAIPSLPIVGPRGRFQFIPNAVTVSSGSAMTSDYLCTGMNTAGSTPVAL